MRRLNDMTNTRSCRVLIRLAMIMTAFCFALSPSAAQKKEDPNAKEKALITKIKRSPDKYIYAEVTCKTKEEAETLAEEMFYENVNEYVTEVKKLKAANDVVINDAKGLSQAVSMPRGSNMYRAFFYVKKSDIVAMNNPVLLPGHQPVAEQDKPQKVKDGKNDAEAGQDDAVAVVCPVYPEAAKELAKLKTVKELNAVLKRMKQSGDIVAFAKYNDVGLKSEWYLVLYDATGAVKAVLSDGEARTNVDTGQADSVENYPKHAALCVQFK